VGDLHFSEGDGEPTTAIEMSGIVTLRVSIMPRHNPFLPVRLASPTPATSTKSTTLSIPSFLPAPVYTTSPSEPQYLRRLVFIGLSTRPNGSQVDNGGQESYQNAAWQAIDYLTRWGWTREQAYIILSCAPIETKVVATANHPNFVVSLGLPLDAFKFDISPKAWKGRVQMNGPAVVSAERMIRGKEKEGK
jgi:formamidase